MKFRLQWFQSLYFFSFLILFVSCSKTFFRTKEILKQTVAEEHFNMIYIVDTLQLCVYF